MNITLMTDFGESVMCVIQYLNRKPLSSIMWFEFDSKYRYYYNGKHTVTVNRKYILPSEECLPSCAVP